MKINGTMWHQCICACPGHSCPPALEMRSRNKAWTGHMSPQQLLCVCSLATHQPAVGQGQCQGPMKGASEDGREMWEGLEQMATTFPSIFLLIFFLLRHNSHGINPSKTIQWFLVYLKIMNVSPLPNSTTFSSPQIETLQLLAVTLYFHVPLHGFSYLGHFICMESCNICPSVPDTNMARCFQISSLLQHVSVPHFFFRVK